MIVFPFLFFIVPLQIVFRCENSFKSFLGACDISVYTCLRLILCLILYSFVQVLSIPNSHFLSKIEVITIITYPKFYWRVYRCRTDLPFIFFVDNTCFSLYSAFSFKSHTKPAVRRVWLLRKRTCREITEPPQRPQAHSTWWVRRPNLNTDLHTSSPMLYPFK